MVKKKKIVMKEYVPTAQDVEELNLAAEKITDEALKSKPLCKIARATNFYKELNKPDAPDSVTMKFEGITPRGKTLVDRIIVTSEYSYKKPDHYL
jgi:hypothetical protein